MKRSSVIIIIFGILLLSGVFPCVLWNTTGFPCPACGITRAWHSALCGDFSAAFTMHPLFWLVPVMVISAIIKPMRGCKVLWICILALFLSVWIVRLILYFPDTPPLNYNKSSIVYKIYDLLVQ